MSDRAILAADRLRGQLHNSTPRRDRFTLTRWEAEALIEYIFNKENKR